MRINKVASSRGLKRKTWDTEKLKDKEKLEQYQREIHDTIQKDTENVNSEDTGNVEILWKKIERTISRVANKCLGKKMFKRNAEWFDEECRSAIQEKNEARLRVLHTNTRSNMQRYKEKRKHARKLCKKKKQLFLKNRIIEIEEQRRQNNKIRDFYRNVKQLNKSYQPKLEACKDKNGTLLTEENKIVNRWKQYFEELLNVQTDDSMNVKVDPDQNYMIPNLTDVQEAVMKLKNNKAPGENSITAELYKYGGRPLLEELHKLICKIWESEEMPSGWKTSLIRPIYKKGCKLECSNYRGIMLLDVAYKILSNLIYKKLNDIAENRMGEYQSGFRYNRSTIDHIFTMRQTIEKCYEFNIDLHMLFIDFKQAFDSILRSQIVNALVWFGTPTKLIRLIMMILEESNARVVVQNKISETFLISSGVKQGDALSALLFNMTLHYAIGKIDNNGTIINKSYQICAYSDDIVIISRNYNKMIEIFEMLEHEAAKVGLRINENKTKYMRISRSSNENNLEYIKIGNYNIENVKNFKYLGALLNNNNNIAETIQERIQAGSKCYWANIKILRSKLITRATKMRIYKTLIRPIVTYGAETWTMTVYDENRLRIFERKILRRIYGPAKLDNDNYVRRTNSELNDLIENEDIVRYIKSLRLRWIGHVLRMNDTRKPLRILRTNPQNVRNQGRPKTRWYDNIQHDIKKMNVRNWRQRAQDRNYWSAIVQEAKTHLGL